tara:strand:+ start:450 stop:1211 length:762 start_codon:yes stop_codon:yes gene_type:complete
MSYAKRLKALGGAWKNDKAKKGGAGISAGKHQYEITRATFEESKMSYNKGHMQVSLEITVATGADKGRKGWINVDLEQEATTKFPTSGIARFKGHLETLGMELPAQLSEKAIRALLAEMVGIVFNGACVINAKGYPNHYINDLVHAAGEGSDDEDDEDEEDDEEDDDDSEDSDSDEDDEEDDDDDEDEDDDEEEEEDEEDEPAPPKKKAAKKDPKKLSFKPAPKKAPAKAKAPVKGKKAEDEDEEDFDDDWDE